MDMRADQERRFCALVQNQREDRELFRSWMDREVRAGENPTAPAPPTHMPVQKMGPQDDPEAFLDLFEKTAVACGWPQTDWPVRLIPLLTGEAQLAAQQLPVQNLLVYDDLKRAILQRVGQSPEQHRQRFRSLELGENGRPFVMTHQLRDACRRWLLAGEGGVDQIIDRVVLEQFIARLPKKTTQWVQCHRPASLDLAIQLAEDQMVACHGVGETLPSVSLSLPSPSVSPPIFLSRSRAGVVPRARTRWRGGPAPESAAGRAHAREAGSASPSSALIPAPPGSPRQFLVPLPATRVAGKPGPACWRCGDPGHFIDRCPVMEVGTLVRVPDAPQAGPDQAGGYQIPVSIRGGTYWALVDSGCNQTSIHQSLIQPEALDKSCMVRVRCVHGDMVKYPVVLLTIQFRGQKHKVEVAVNPHLRHPLILGTNWPAFKILLGVLCVDASCGKEKPEGEAAVRTGEAEPGPAEAAPGERSAVERLILTERDDFPLEQSQDESLRNAFDQVRSIDGRPLQSARPPSYPYFAILKDRLYRVTQDAQSKQDTTQLLVPKTDGSVRFCVDYRKVNVVSKFDAYPMPRVDELLDWLGTARFYSTLDLTKGYWQIPLSPLSKEKSAFTTPFGLHQFITLPFGLFGAPVTFQRLMDKILRPHTAYAAAYLDDIIIYSQDWQRHMVHLREVLRALRGAGLTANPKKCAIGRVEVRYLGFHFCHGQVRPQIDKTAAIAACPRPKTKKEVRQFLGLAGYYRRFIPDYSELTSPLTDLTKKEVPDTVPWTEQCQQAFTQVKAALCGGPLLHSPDFSLPFLLQTDASDRGLGAVLTQEIKGEERPVLYISRKLSKRETMYSTIEKECLAIRWAVLTLRYYLLGREFTLCSNHAPLQWLHRMKDTNARITRWYLALQPFKFKVIHRPGTQMVVADFLSRKRGGGGGCRPEGFPA